MSVELMTVQALSTALTVTVKGLPTVCGSGVPVLPVEVPGAAVSPGIKTCNLVKICWFRRKKFGTFDASEVEGTSAYL